MEVRNILLILWGIFFVIGEAIHGIIGIALLCIAVGISIANLILAFSEDKK